jgi:methionyl-tRNA formyltransferase
MSEKKKLIFCTYSSIYSSKVLSLLLADKDVEIVAIINSTRVLSPQYGHLRGSIEQIRISGLRYSSYLFLVTEVFRWIQPLLQLFKCPLKSVHAYAKQYGIPILDSPNINNSESIGFITKYMPEYLLAAHFNQLVKTPLLNNSGIECINIHPSLLPTYKGVDPVFQSLLDGNKTIGVTLHRMAETFDSGENLMQLSLQTNKGKSLFFNNSLLFEEGAKLALEWIKNNKMSQELTSDDQKPVASYDSWPTPYEVKAFRKSGKRLIHLSELLKFS